MTILVNVLLATLMIAGYGGYALYERAHGDSADLFTLIRSDIASSRAGANADVRANNAPAEVPEGMTAQDYADYLARVNADAAAYRASRPQTSTPPRTGAGPTTAQAPARVSAPAAVVRAQPEASAKVVVQTQSETPARAENSTVATVSNTNTVAQQAAIPTPSPDPTPVPQPVVESQPAVPAGRYRDGTYRGSSVDVFYGFVQVSAKVSGGNLTDVTFLSYPNDRRQSVQINDYAMPRLIQQAIAAQSASVNGVSGATDTSMGFRESLAAALSQA